MRALVCTVLFVSFTAHGDTSPLFSYSTDRRLMTEIQRLGALENGMTVYAWHWNETARQLDSRYGASDSNTAYGAIGFIAQDIQDLYPTAVSTGVGGYLRIDARELAAHDQFIRWKLTSTSKSVAGRCARVLETRFILCF